MKMFKEGLKPVYKFGNSEWRRVEANVLYYLTNDNNVELTFAHYFIHRTDYYLAFTYPWSYTDNLKFLESI